MASPTPAAPARRFAQTGKPAQIAGEFKHYGQSGIEVSDLFPEVGTCVDDMCVMRLPLRADNTAHGGAIAPTPYRQRYVWFVPRWEVGWSTAWGTENQNLPRLYHHLPHPRTRRGAELVQRIPARHLPGDAYRKRRH